MIRRYILGITLVLALAACGGTTPQPNPPGPPPPPPPGGNGTISGTVNAPAGGSVANVRVAACVVNGNSADCNAAGSKIITITASGQSASFSITGLVDGNRYGVFAAKDVDGNGRLSNGDYDGCYGDDGQGGCLVARPPKSDANVQMKTVSGVTMQNMGLLGRVWMLPEVLR
jgi:serine protease